MTLNDMPESARLLCTLCDAWVVGSSALVVPPEGADIDVMVPLHRWHMAVTHIPPNAVPNNFRGWRWVEDGVQIDCWPDTLDRLCAVQEFRAAWHPKSGQRVHPLQDAKGVFRAGARAFMAHDRIARVHQERALEGVWEDFIASGGLANE